MSAAWLPNNLDASRRAIVLEALDNLGILEMPRGSNSSPAIDGWNKACGVAVASPWCAAFASHCWAAGHKVYASASCEDWHRMAIRTGTFTQRPQVGDVALFALGTELLVADHCGIVVRVDDVGPLTVEGNTNEAGGREGVGVFLKDRVALGARILGYVSVTPL